MQYFLRDVHGEWYVYREDADCNVTVFSELDESWVESGFFSVDSLLAIGAVEVSKEKAYFAIAANMLRLENEEKENE